MSVPVAALDGGAGGNPIDSPGTSPAPNTVTAPLGGESGVAGSGDEGVAPIPFPGEEDDEEVAEGDHTAVEDEEDANASHAGPSASTPPPTTGAARGGRGRGRGRGGGGGRGKPRGGGSAKVAPTLEPLPKPDVAPGTCQLPNARVKKIIMSDPDVESCGRDATFAIGKACEIYIHHLVDAAYTQARLDGHKAVVYKDIARAIKNTPYLEFLMDVVPMAMPLSQALSERQRHSDYAAALETGLSGDPNDSQVIDAERSTAPRMANGGDVSDDDAVMEDAGKRVRGNGHATAMDLDDTSADQMNTHGLPPLASQAAGDVLRERVGSVEDVEDL